MWREEPVEAPLVIAKLKSPLLRKQTPRLKVVMALCIPTKPIPAWLLLKVNKEMVFAIRCFLYNHVKHVFYMLWSWNPCLGDSKPHSFCSIPRNHVAKMECHCRSV